MTSSSCSKNPNRSPYSSASPASSSSSSVGTTLVSAATRSARLGHTASKASDLGFERTNRSRFEYFNDSWTSDVPFGPELLEGFFWVPPLSDDFEPDWWEDPNWSYDATSSEYQDAENALNEWLNAPVPGYESPDINWDEAFNTIMDLDYTFRSVSPEDDSGSPMSWLTSYEGGNPPDSMDWEVC